MNKKKLLYTIFLMITIVITGTLAYFTITTDRTALVLTLGEQDEVFVTLEPFEIKGTLASTTDYTSFETNDIDNDYIQITAENFSVIPKKVIFYYRINSIDSPLISTKLKYTITSSSTINGTYTEVETGNFSTAVAGHDLTVFEFDIPANTTIFYRVFTYLDGNENVTSMANSLIEAEFRAEMEHIITPELDEGMIPVILTTEGEVGTLSPEHKYWYNYEKHNWANAVLVTEESRSKYLGTEGVIIEPEDILGFFVWIPRYEYRYNNLGTNYAGGAQLSPGAISINFIPSYVTTPTSSAYKIHPAFTFGDKQINGFWMGKCVNEGGATDRVTNSCKSAFSLDYSDTLENGTLNLSTQFKQSLQFNGGTLNNGQVTFEGSSYYGTTSNFDSHMAKNSEISAATYLGHSIYGSCANETECYLGVSPISTVYYDINSDEDGPWKDLPEDEAIIAQLAVYSGIFNEPFFIISQNEELLFKTYTNEIFFQERTMSVLQHNSNFIYSGLTSGKFETGEVLNSGFYGYIGDIYYDTDGYTQLPPSKYYDRYTSTNISNACNGEICYGHGLSETSGWYYVYSNNEFVTASSPWMARDNLLLTTDTFYPGSLFFSIKNNHGGNYYNSSDNTPNGYSFARTVIVKNTTTADTTPPIITFSVNGNAAYAKSHSTVVTATGKNEIAILKYLWSTDKTASAKSGTNFISGDTITKADGDGLWHLCVYAVDTKGNEGESCSSGFLFDNTGPTITTVGSEQCLQKKSTLNVLDFVTVTDGGVGVSSSNITATLSGASVTNLSSKATGNYTVTYNAVDNLGNAGTSKTITFNVYTKVLNDQSLKTSGSGFYADEVVSGRYLFSGASPNNFVVFNSKTWRILAYEPNGKYKIIDHALSETHSYHSTSSGLLNYDNLTINTYFNNYYNNTLTATSRSYVSAQKFAAGPVKDATSLANIISKEKSTYISKYVSLPNISDFIRASSDCTQSITWGQVVNDYACANNNWMRKSSEYLFLNPYLDTRVSYQNTSGGVSYNTVASRYVRPTLYLKDTTTFTGTGTNEDKYRICTNCLISVKQQKSTNTCQISTTSGWETSKTLTITPSSTTNVGNYSWNLVTWGTSNTKTIDKAGKYTAYIKDNTNAINTCSINISSRPEYSSRTCPNANLSFGEWNQATTEYVSSCSTYSKDTAETNYDNSYHTCQQLDASNPQCGGTACYLRTNYVRDAACSSFEGATWSSYGTTPIIDNFKTEVQIRTTYSAS